MIPFAVFFTLLKYRVVIVLRGGFFCSESGLVYRVFWVKNGDCENFLENFGILLDF